MPCNLFLMMLAQLQWVSLSVNIYTRMCIFTLLIPRYMVVWSNFEIADLDFWRSDAYLKFFEFLDQSGGFYYEASVVISTWVVPSELSYNLSYSVEAMRLYIPSRSHYLHTKTKLSVWIYTCREPNKASAFPRWNRYVYTTWFNVRGNRPDLKFEKDMDMSMCLFNIVLSR